MTTPKTLRLKKPLSFSQQARLSQTIHLPAKQEHPKNHQGNKENKKASVKKLATALAERNRLRKQGLLDAIHWLCTTYPHCFNREAPKPLRVGILNDILLDGKWSPSKTYLRKTLKSYTGALRYQEALLEKGKRYTLTGEAVQDITDYERGIAIQKVQFIKERIKAKS